jgi:hypothetical protein
VRETIPDLSRCVILSLRSEMFPNYEEPMGIVEVFTLDYLNPMGFYETRVWTEER